jgi:hypothetical protein
MKPALVSLLITIGGVCGCYANEAVTLDRVMSNTRLHGVFPLDQGYRGKFTRIYDDESKVPVGEKPFEFTYASLNDMGVGNEAPKGQAIVIGVKEVGKVKIEASMFPAYYLSALPSFDALLRIKSIADFERVFGPFRGWTDLWGSFDNPPEVHSSLWWMAFTPCGNGAIRVVRVFITTTDRGHGVEIDKRVIMEGSFLPTGLAPVPTLVDDGNNNVVGAQNSR